MLMKCTNRHVLEEDEEKREQYKIVSKKLKLA